MRNKKTTRNQPVLKKSNQRNKQLSSLPYKILGAIFEMNKRKTSSNGQEDKKVLYPTDDIDRQKKKRGRKTTEWIFLEKKNYNHLEILEVCTIKQAEIKKKVKK